MPRYSLTQQVLLIIVAGILVWLPLPLGSNRFWALSVAELLIFTTALLTLTAWLAGAVRSRASVYALVGIGCVWLLWLGWIVFQSVEFPPATAHRLAAYRAGLQAPLVSLGFEDPDSPFSISVYRGATVAHLLESLAYFALFMTVCLLCGGSRRNLRLLCWVIMFSGLLQATYGALMVITGLEWGPLIKKEHYLGSATGTFVNRNHLAGYLELSLAAGAGLLLAYRGETASGGLIRRLLENLGRHGAKGLIIRISLVLIVTGLILSQSRGGNAAAVGGLLTAGLFFVLIKRGKYWLRIASVLIGVLLIDAWLIGDSHGLNRLYERYEATDLETDWRAQHFRELPPMIEAYHPTGSGLGTFEYAYPDFNTPYIRSRPRHAHNDYLQFLIEVGVIGSSILGLLVLATFWRACVILRKREETTYTGVAFAGLMAMCSIAIHSIVDFNLQIPANAATLVVLMAAIWSCRPESRRATPKPRAS